MRTRLGGVAMTAVLWASLWPAVAQAGQPRILAQVAGSDPTVSTMTLASGSRVHVMRPHGFPLGGQSGAGISTGNGIDYNGGPVVPSERVKAIYWATTTIYRGGPSPGTSGSAALDGSLVGYFLRSLGGSTYYNINTTYGDTVSGGHTVSNSLAYTGYWADAGDAPSAGSYVSDTSIQSEILKGLKGGQLTYDPSTVYALFSGYGTNLGGGAFSQYCAYHGSFPSTFGRVLYAVMPYDYTSPAACSALVGSPNGDAAADAEVNTLAHELEEANTDPQGNAWYDSAGYENADKCAWTFGTVFVSGGGYANITVGAKTFLVQQNWVNANGGYCAQGYLGTGLTVPGAPTGLGASAATGSVHLSWTAPLSNGGATITNYNVYRSTTSGTESLLVQLGAVTSYTDSAVASGQPYYYTVAAVNSAGPSGPSNEATATPPSAITVPGAPILTASPSPSTERHGVQLSWTVPASNGAPITAYRIYRATSTGREELLTTVSATTTGYRDASTLSGATYYYEVAAVNAFGIGPLSNQASVIAR